MDKERVKFVLSSFRPDGADTEDTDFAEALRLATSDRELGEWFMRERAFDAEFAEALARVNLPDGLRETVLLAMVQNCGSAPKIDLKEDRTMIATMARIEVPVGLREKIIEAMDQTAKANPRGLAWWKIGVPLAAAAGIAFAFVFMKPDERKPIARTGSGVPIEAVQASFVRTFESPLFSLDDTDKESQHLVAYLKRKGLPCGDGFIPDGLKGVKRLGCRELVIDGKRGSLICFDEKNGTVHLIIFRRDDIKGTLPEVTAPRIEQSGDWAKASWEQGNYAFVLMSLRDSKNLAALF